MPLFSRQAAPLCFEQGYLDDCVSCALGHFFSSSELHNSAKHGCPDCQAIAEGFEAAGCVPPFNYVLTRGDSGPLVASIGDGSWAVSFYVTPDSSIKNPDARIGNHISQDAASDECFSLARSWLDLCDAQHRCHRSDPEKYPKRLLDLGLSLDKNIRLVLTSDPEFDKSTSYVCLSYCWGNAPKESLNRDSVARFRKQGFKPKTKIFLDAIRATHKLGFRCLWTDAFCIAQDDRQEFEIESLRMGDIYANAAVTLMAATAKHSDSFFLIPTKERKASQPIHICKSPDPDLRPDVFVREFVRIKSSEPEIALDTSSEPAYPSLGTGNQFIRGHTFAKDYTIDSRAWCLQEETLNSRLLRFESEGIVFRCLKTVYSESGQSEPVWDGSSWDEEEWKSMTKSSKYHLDGADAALVEKWTRTIVSISSRNLTYKRDILPCTSGLAARYKQLSGKDDDYLAGIWKKGFIEYLLWTPDKPRKPSKAAYLSPSWSWPSHRGPVSYTDFYLGVGSSTPFSKLVDAKCMSVGHNVLGEVSGGFAIMEGPSMTMWINNATSWRPQLMSSKARFATFDLAKRDLDIPLESLLRHKPDFEVLCLTRHQKLSTLASGGEISTNWFFLILKKTMDANEETFERIGLWRPDYVGMEPFDGESWLHGARNRLFKIV